MLLPQYVLKLNGLGHVRTLKPPAPRLMNRGTAYLNEELAVLGG